MTAPAPAPATAGDGRWQTICHVADAQPSAKLNSGDIGLPTGTLPKVKDSAVVKLDGTRLELRVVRGSFDPCAFKTQQVKDLQKAHAGKDIELRPWRFYDGLGKLATAKGVTTVLLPLAIAIITLLSAIQGAADQTAKYRDLAKVLHGQLADAARDAAIPPVESSDLVEITTTGQLGLLPSQPLPEPFTPRAAAQARMGDIVDAQQATAAELQRRIDAAQTAQEAAATRLDELTAAPPWWKQSGLAYKALTFLVALVAAMLGIRALRPGAV